MLYWRTIDKACRVMYLTMNLSPIPTRVKKHSWSILRMYLTTYCHSSQFFDTLYIIVMVVSYVMLTTTLSSAHVAHLDSSTRFTKRLVVHLELLRICDSFLRKLSASSSLCNTDMSFFCMNSACKFRFDLVFHPFEPSEIARKTDRGLTAVSACSTYAFNKKNSLCFSSNPL